MGGGRCPALDATGAWHLASSDKQLLHEALSDFDRSITMSNFGTTAEGHAMRAQTLTVLGHQSEASAAASAANALDARAFLVDRTCPAQLLAPWPLPPPPNGGELHTFESASLTGPHFCDHCLGFITHGSYSCTCCNFTVHRGCLAKTQKLKTCWKAFKATSTQAPLQEDIAHETHVHQMSFERFYGVASCDSCNESIGAFSGYQCVECGHRVHAACLDSLQNCVIVERESLCLTC